MSRKPGSTRCADFDAWNPLLLLTLVVGHADFKTGDLL